MYIYIYTYVFIYTVRYVYYTYLIVYIKTCVYITHIYIYYIYITYIYIYTHIYYIYIYTCHIIPHISAHMFHKPFTSSALPRPPPCGWRHGRCVASPRLCWPSSASDVVSGELKNMLFMGKKGISSCFQELSGNVSLFQWMIDVIWWYLMVFEAYSKFLPSITGNSMTVLPSCRKHVSRMVVRWCVPLNFQVSNSGFFFGLRKKLVTKTHFRLLMGTFWKNWYQNHLQNEFNQTLMSNFDRTKWMMFHIHRKTSTNKCIYIYMHDHKSEWNTFHINGKHISKYNWLSPNPLTVQLSRPVTFQQFHFFWAVHTCNHINH